MLTRLLVLFMALYTIACGRIEIDTVVPKTLHRGDLVRFTLSEKSEVEDVQIDGHPVYAVRALRTSDDSKPYAFETRVPNEVSNGKAYLSARIAGSRQEQEIEVLPSERPKFLTVSVSDEMGCALDDKNHVWCWGRFDDMGFPTPVRVALEEYEQVEVGDDRWCALTPAGEVHCFRAGIRSDSTAPCCYAEIIPSVFTGEYFQFGRTTSGDLIDLETEMQGRRQALPFKGDAFAANDDSACGIDQDGEIFCWGKNDYGQLGNGTTDSTVIPTPISVRGPWTAIAYAGQTMCALKALGIPWCWGALNYKVSPGNVEFTISSIPLELRISQVGQDRVPTPAFATLRASRDTFCGIAQEKIWCWGFRSIASFLINTRLERREPKLVDEAGDWVAVDPAPNRVCAVKAIGEIWCWAINDSWFFTKQGAVKVE